MRKVYKAVVKASQEAGMADELHILWMETIIDAYEAIGELRERVEYLEKLHEGITHGK